MEEACRRQVCIHGNSEVCRGTMTTVWDETTTTGRRKTRRWRKDFVADTANQEDSQDGRGERARGKERERERERERDRACALGAWARPGRRVFWLGGVCKGGGKQGH